MSKYLLAHDVGTSGNKSTLFSTEGKLIKSIVKAYNTMYSNFTWAEQNPNDLFDAVCYCSKVLLKDIDAKDVVGVCFTGQMQGAVCIDKQGNVLRNSIIYCDQRSVKQAESVLEKIGEDKAHDITGHRINAVFTGPKLMWLRENEPDVYRQIYKVFHAKDYLVYRLTGEISTDYSDASGMNLFDINKYEWNSELLDIMKIDESILPRVFPSTAIVGTVTKKAQELSGIKEGTPVVIGAGDGVAAAIGAGSLNVGDTYTCLGTSGWIGTTIKDSFIDRKNRIDVWCHAFKGSYHAIGVMQTVGTSYKWAKDNIFDNEFANSNYEMMNELVRKSPAGANGVVFLPYLMGERCPLWTDTARACCVGMSYTTTKGDILRAVLEGTIYNLKWILDILTKETPINNMVLIGGCARSDVWKNAVADIFNLEIKYLNNLEEATSIGAAIIGGVGLGVYKDFEEANVFNSVCGSVFPNEINVKEYEKKVEMFKEIYGSLSSIFTKYY